MYKQDVDAKIHICTQLHVYTRANWRCFRQFLDVFWNTPQTGHTDRRCNNVLRRSTSSNRFPGPCTDVKGSPQCSLLSMEKCPGRPHTKHTHCVWDEKSRLILLPVGVESDRTRTLRLNSSKICICAICDTITSPRLRSVSNGSCRTKRQEQWSFFRDFIRIDLPSLMLTRVRTRISREKWNQRIYTLHNVGSLPDRLCSKIVLITVECHQVSE